MCWETYFVIKWCVYAAVNYANIVSYNGLMPVRSQASIYTNAHFLSIIPLGPNISDIWMKIQQSSLNKMHLKMSYAKWRPFHHVLNILSYILNYILQLDQLTVWRERPIPLEWRHNERDSVSNHQPHDCLLNRLFKRRSKKTTKCRVTGLCVGIHRGPVNSAHKWPVTRKMFPFDDVIMHICTSGQAIQHRARDH